MKNVKPRSKVLLLFLSFLYLPGTMLHEGSHYLVARLLLVPVARFTIMPRFENGEFILGSVSIGRVDFIRRFIVGVAPFVVGIGALLTLIYLLNLNLGVVQNTLFIYLVVCVINTMWLSKSDMNGVWKVLLFLTLALVLFFVLH